MISSMKQEGIYPLCLWEEAIGKLEEIGEKDGNCIAVVGKIHIAIPYDLKQRLQPHIGQEIAVLRTDLQQKEYLFRILTEEPNL